MKTTPVIVLLPVLFAIALSETDTASKRKQIVNFIKSRRAHLELPEKRRWKGKMYSKLRKDESPPPTNNQLAPSQYDATPPPGGAATPAAGYVATRPPGAAPTFGGRPPYGGGASPFGASPYPQQPMSPYGGRQQQPHQQQFPQQFPQRYPQQFPQQFPQGYPPQSPYGQPIGQQPGFGGPGGAKGKPLPKGPQGPPPQAGGAGGGCGTATVCGSFSLTKEDPTSVIAPPPRLVFNPQQQPCMPPMQAGCGGMQPMMPQMMPQMMPPMQSPMCPSICNKRCMVTCPRACCTKSAVKPESGDESDETKNKHIKCPAVCSVYCAPECPHICCGPGGARRSNIPQAFHASELTPPALFKLEQEAGDLKRH